MAEEQGNSSAAGTNGGEAAPPGQGTNGSATQAASDTTGGTDQQQEIKDPAAYYKAQAEKLERLHKNALEELNSLKANQKAVEKSIVEDMQRKYEAMAKELKDSQTELEKERDQAMRLRALSEAGLSADMAHRIHGTTQEEMIEDAKALAALFPSGGGKAKGEGAKTGHTAGGSTLTMDAVKAMSPDEYLARKEEVDTFLRQQK